MTCSKELELEQEKMIERWVPLYSEIEAGKKQASSFSQWFQN